ncbi:MAG TPA: hypothetical protein VIG08_08695 [Gemmatimonadales bacterium]
MIVALGLALLLQTREVTPVISFPDAGLDDTTAYQGYQTRFYRDSRDNVLQVYLEPRSGRVVNLWADAANESLGFTARDPAGKPVRLEWSIEQATVGDSAESRWVEYRLTAPLRRIQLGWFLLGSMRVERDFQYAGRHLAPFTKPPFYVAEESVLVANVARLPSGEQTRHLKLLDAGSVAILRARLQPTLLPSTSDSAWRLRVQRPSLDARSRLFLEISVDPRETASAVREGVLWLRSREDSTVHLTVRVTTDATPLTPLPRDAIFTAEFLEWLRGEHADSTDEARPQRLEREVRSVELLVTREKLMAGLPNFATYFGRDMMMTALMMRGIWRPDMAELVIASVLRKLGPDGGVSHEEAVGGQAIRENAAAYSALIAGYLRAARSGRSPRADSLLASARDVLDTLGRVRENYNMIDDEFQLPVLTARYLADTAVTAARKRAFLLDSTDGGGTRLTRLLREMALVAAMTRPYAKDPSPANLVGFVKRDSTHWRSASWRDSDAGYANGRFAMDVNAIWAPRALEAIATIARTLPKIGLGLQAPDSVAGVIAGTPLGGYLAHPPSLRQAIDTWKGARRHFEVAFGAGEIQRRVGARLASLPAAERRYWEQTMTEEGELGDSLAFLTLSLDSAGRPIPIPNTDPATDLFLGGFAGDTGRAAVRPEPVLADLEPFVRDYPVGLFVGGLGPVVANDAYATPDIWERFEKDAYHAPRVVWGREVNLLLLGLANRLSDAFDASGALRDPTFEPYVRALGDALTRTLAAVTASGLEHSELWSYRIEDGRLIPTRYGTGSDVQLWSTTDLAVRYALSHLPTRP